MKTQTLLGVFLLSLCICRAEVSKPNIIVIMADDLGYGDLSCYGAKVFQTPNIDKLAAQGQRFTSGYCSASTCTPTRFSLLTGTYAIRAKNTGIAPPNGPAIIRPGTTTLPALLQQAGYRTAVIGKWHLGLGDKKPDWNGEIKPGPLEIGFHECFMLPTTNDRVPQVYVENHKVLNLDPADPLTVSDTPIDPKEPTGISARDTLKIDWTHGHNGTIHNGISRIGFYTGGKAARFRDEDLADKWIEKSKAYIAANKDKPFFLYFAALTGVPLPADACLDSIDILSALLGENDGTGRDELVQQDNGTRGKNADFGLRSGDWKLIRRATHYKQSAVISKNPIPAPVALHTLYFLPDDPSEKKDVSKENPELLKEFIERLDSIIAAGRSRS